MRITNLNPDTEIGASSWFLDIEGHRILLDAGMHPGRDGREGLPLYSLIKDEPLDAIALSHCHHDHVGSLPVALRQFPKAHVLMTELSYFLIERVLHNSVNVMARQRDELGIKEYPLFSHDEVDEIASVFQGFRYNREIEWISHQKRQAGCISPTIEFYDAGHALGSAGMMVRGGKQTLFFTGDVNFKDQTILKAARFEDVKADVLIMETTRGNRAVPEGFTREAEVERLCQAIEHAQKGRGCILIPTFALGRTQEILALLGVLMKSGRVRRQPIYIGGLGRVFTEIYDIEAHRTHRQLSQMKLTEALNLVVLEKGQAEKMKLSGSRIFVVTAGMMTEHTAAHDLALRMIGDERQSIFFVGYAEPSTPGGRLKQSKPGETFILSPSGGEVTHRCNVQEFDLTAHANRDELLDFVDQVSPRVVVLGHGNTDSRAWFAEQINRKHPKIKVLQPKPGECLEV
ncbi:MAG: MBL fold metallo-hydrolase [Verrucomicrobiales bacterium]|jgi:Cft2 family RNA processing exonuclease|nr:MBL fold metallo-hydrolase [Verrucomicrobiales bacterium]